ncbi:cadherin EGF LAG seven-pass G-type receptor 2 [Elysia marginata]|uniref:Cadherin EGF LAG seven-pass G-type receptor 2 n=1 Tax=Elysia marginata TaxID=1093978 RepID=A0AAV4HHJ1_9GAST|nr:cadherin EGF LAG seven-pass G-type receptor 2 [Elysia marginata]
MAVDPDGSDASFGDIQYSILSGDTSNHFAIDASTGQITVRKALDFETDSSYDLVIQAKERGGTNSASATQTINLNDVNDEWPACTSYSFTETVAEDEVADFVVRALGCSDDDAGTTLTYTIASGNTVLFKVEGGSLKLKDSLDFETDQTHDLTIQVSDGDASHNREIVGTVTVGGVDEGEPIYTQNVYDASVSESEATGHLVATVVANDPDSSASADGEVSYSFVATYSEFVLDEASGKITLAQQLDRETAVSHTLLVKAEDATGSNTATVSVTVLDANDNTPVFQLNPYSGSLNEGDSTGTLVATVSATDGDDTGNNYGVVTYTLNSGGAAGALTGTTVVVVTVNTVNEHDPIFSPITTNVNIAENDFSVGDVIATVTASDADTGSDGQFTFAFVSAQSKFSLSQRGVECDLRLEQALDFESGDTTFSVEIKATGILLGAITQRINKHNLCLCCIEKSELFFAGMASPAMFIQYTTQHKQPKYMMFHSCLNMM